MAGGGADNLANQLAESLLAGQPSAVAIPDFNDPKYEVPDPSTSDLYGPVVPLRNEDLTTKVTGGTGTFDYLMDAFKAHLAREYETNRITGEQYTKAYIALTEGAMGNATQFLLGKDQAYWNAVGAQLQARRAEVEAVTARVALESEKARLQMLTYDAMTSRINYALTKMRLASESVAFDTATYQLNNLLPAQKQLADKQVQQVTAEIAGVNARTAMTTEQTIGVKFENDALNPLKKSQLEKQIAQQIAETLNIGKQGLLLDNEAAMQSQKVDMLAKQILGQVAQNLLLGKQADNVQQDINLGPQKLALLIRQVANQEAQTANLTKQGQTLDKELELYPTKKLLLAEQAESQRAQTLDTRSDNVPVSGSMGQQRALYAQQIVSYKRDAEMKAAKVFIDAWTVMKTIDEGLAPPLQFSNANLDTILATLKANNGY